MNSAPFHSLAGFKAALHARSMRRLQRAAVGVVEAGKQWVNAQAIPEVDRGRTG